jgi:predicted metal-dependent HD superfamily phosphohydrolase
VLKEQFIQLISKYTSNKAIQEELWNEIAAHYSSPGRHYHNLSHLANVFGELSEIKGEIKNWESVLFSLFYHDIIYDPSKGDNEIMSSLLAAKRMKEISVPTEIIEMSTAQILATAAHAVSDDDDINLFNDADMSILGQDWETYQHYSAAIRKEFAIYSDSVYTAGRRKVLEGFLAMARIFKTDTFHQKYNKRALENIGCELH